MDTIYNPQCYSLFTDDVESDDCLKRVFKVKNIETDEDIKILVCAEYFRLLYSKYYEKGNFYTALHQTLDESIGIYVPHWQNKNISFFAGNRNLGRSFEGIIVGLEILQRPFRYLSIPIFDAFSIILESKYKCNSLKRQVVYSLIEYLKLKNPLVKDKKTYLLIRDSFGLSIRNNRPEANTYKDLDENSLIELISHLLIKYN